MHKLLKKHNFVFNKEDCGGTELSLTTLFYDNGDAAVGLPHGILTNQELTLNSYGNSVTMNLCSAALTPEILRQLANELERAELESEILAKKAS